MPKSGPSVFMTDEEREKLNYQIPKPDGFAYETVYKTPKRRISQETALRYASAMKEAAENQCAFTDQQWVIIALYDYIQEHCPSVSQFTGGDNHDQA